MLKTSQPIIILLQETKTLTVPTTRVSNEVIRMIIEPPTYCDAAPHLPRISLLYVFCLLSSAAWSNRGFVRVISKTFQPSKVPITVHILSCHHISFKINMSLIQPTRAPPEDQRRSPGGGGTLWEPLLYSNSASERDLFNTFNTGCWWPEVTIKVLLICNV
jgi:hypothetical protein